MRRLWVFLFGLVLLGLACQRAAPEDTEEVDAPRTPEAQLEALRTAADNAEAAQEWARAEAAAEALVALDIDRVTEWRERLVVIRKRRRVANIFAEVRDLIDAEAYRTAMSRLEYLEARRLHPDDMAEVKSLKALVETARDTDDSLDLPESAMPDEDLDL